MRIKILTLFPDMFASSFSESIIKRAREKGIVNIELINFRDFATDKHHTVDDTPYGGGPGMLIKVDVINRALIYAQRQSSHAYKDSLQSQTPKRQSLHPQKDCLYLHRKTILLTPSGQKFDQKKAYEYSRLDELILIAGHYEGFDQRIHDHLVDEEISIGDYVLSGGELPAMVITDSIIRLLPGAIRPESLESETFNIPSHPESSFCHPESNEGSHHLQENSSSQVKDYALGPQNDVFCDYPQYTRPAKYKGWKVPDILLSGHHAEIKKWRESQR